jgi:proline iminopeptidase
MLTDQGADVEWTGWTCDELTPDLCDLEVSLDSVTVRGIDIQIWKYSYRGATKTEASSSSSSSSSSQDLLPIVAIHGGPAWPHNYMLPLKQQACMGRDIYFYDQAGCGNSELPPQIINATVADDFPWLLTSSYYAEEELPAVISHLGLDDYHIIGNSWGTIVSQYFALDTKHPGLASMVLSGPLSDAQFYIQSQWDDADGSLGSLPPFVQQRIKELEAAKEFDSPEYGAIADFLTTKFSTRTAPIPDCFLQALSGVNLEIYVGGQGPSEFAIGGSLKNFNITHRLKELTDLPILLTHGKYDTVRPAVVDVMYNELPVAENVMFQKSGHVSMIDEPGEMNRVIADFFDRVEASQGSKMKFVPKTRACEDFSSVPVAAGCTDESSAYATNLLLVTGTVLLAFFLGAFLGRSGRKKGQYEGL